MKDGMHLHPAAVWLIGGTYLILITIFAVVTFNCLTLASASHSADLRQAILAATATALCVSPLFYLRKLYLDLFAGLSQSKPTDLPVSSAATIIYFLSRPVFAVVISSLFVVLVYAAVRQFSEGHVGVNVDFIFLSAISAAVISIGTGNAVSHLEKMAKSGHSLFRLPM